MPGAGSPKRIVILDRDLLTCQALARALDGEGDFRVTGTAVSVEDVQDQLLDGEVDFILASRYVESEELFRLARWLRQQEDDHLPRLVVTGLRNEASVIIRYLEAGASGYTLGKMSVSDLTKTLRSLDEREASLSPRLGYLLIRRVAELAEAVRDRGLDLQAVEKLTRREAEVLELLAEDLTNREIAKRLYVSVGTVKSHVHKVLGKLKVQSREAAARVFHLRQAAGSGEES